MRRIAILGCGYVGTSIGAELVRVGDDVVGTTTSDARAGELEAVGIRHFSLNMSERGRLAELLSDRDTVFLTIAAGHQRTDYREIYCESAEHLASALKGSQVSRLIYTSSTGVYHQQDGGWVDEDSPTEPVDKSHQALLDTERLLLEVPQVDEIDSSLSVSIVRLGGIYGPGRDLRARILRNAGKRREGGDAYVNLIQLDDIVAALGGLINEQHQGVLNLCHDTPVQRRELYDRVILAAKADPIQWASPDSPKLGKRVRNHRIKELLSLELRHPRFE
jgi:nucleoside-diphosphate-sugar epimerase